LFALGLAGTAAWKMLRLNHSAAENERWLGRHFGRDARDHEIGMAAAIHEAACYAAAALACACL